MMAGPAFSHDPVRQLGLVVSLTASQLLPAVCECLRLFPCTAAVRQAMNGVVRLRNAQFAACWVVQWLLLLLQVALVDAGDREQQHAGQQGEAVPQGPPEEQRPDHVQGAPEQPMPRVSGAWRRQVLDQVDVVGSLSGVSQLLVAYPRVHLGPGPGPAEPQLRTLLPPGALAACLDAAAAAFPHEVHAAFRGTAEPAAGQGQSGQRGGGGNDQAFAARLFARWLLREGGPLELDGGSWVGSQGSCFWRVLTGRPERARKLREAGERVGHLVGLLVPGEEAWERVSCGSRT